MACTMPHAFGFHRWYEARFGDLCAKHDDEYSKQIGRRQADLNLGARIFQRGYVTLAVLTFIFVRLFGVFHYARGKK